MASPPDRLFQSFFLGGFECSSHRRQDGRRLDLLASSGHERFAASDYRALAREGIRAARDGLRWCRIETAPGRYDWSSFLPMLRASRDAGLQVVWDLCHYGWPDDIDIWSAAFVERFGRFAGAAAKVIRQETGAHPFVCPINEISFWAWAGAEVGRMNPGVHGRGAELKRQLIRAAIAAVEAVREADPRARFLYAEPGIHVDGGIYPHLREPAENYRLAQFEAYDMLSGRMAPELGGRADYLDVVGVNYYPDNQWYLHGNTIPLGHHAYRPLAAILGEYHARYGRPIVVAETGAEGSARPAWLHYLAGEVSAAIAAGAPVEGICLYPILDCAGWANDRVCRVGLFSEPAPDGTRSVYAPLREEIAAHRRSFELTEADPKVRRLPLRRSSG